MKRIRHDAKLLVLFWAVALGLIVWSVSWQYGRHQNMEVVHRMNDVVYEIVDYTDKNNTLPNSLDDLSLPTGLASGIDYKTIASSQYELCAKFTAKNIGISHDPEFTFIRNNTSYGSGYQCFNLSLQFPPKVRNSDPDPTATSSLSDDAERKEDITAIHRQLEAYYAGQGIYPTFAELNSKEWRKAEGFDEDDRIFVDPRSQNDYLSVLPGKDIYSYTVNSANDELCDNNGVDCAKYTLTATLSDGSAYTKEALN